VEVVFSVLVIGLIPASFAACVVLIHIIWVLVRDLTQENVQLNFLLGKSLGFNVTKTFHDERV